MLSVLNVHHTISVLGLTLRKPFYVLKCPVNRYLSLDRTDKSDWLVEDFRNT